MAESSTLRRNRITRSFDSRKRHVAVGGKAYNVWAGLQESPRPILDSEDAGELNLRDLIAEFPSERGFYKDDSTDSPFEDGSTVLPLQVGVGLRTTLSGSYRNLVTSGFTAVIMSERSDIGPSHLNSKIQEHTETRLHPEVQYFSEGFKSDLPFSQCRSQHSGRSHCPATSS